MLSGDTHNHLGLRVDGALKLLKVNGPLRSGRSTSGAISRRVKRDVANSATRHLDVANVPWTASAWDCLFTSLAYSLVEKRLENNDLIALFNETHERTQHSFSSDVS